MDTKQKFLLNGSVDLTILLTFVCLVIMFSLYSGRIDRWDTILSVHVLPQYKHLLSFHCWFLLSLSLTSKYFSNPEISLKNTALYHLYSLPSILRALNNIHMLTILNLIQSQGQTYLSYACKTYIPHDLLELTRDV